MTPRRAENQDGIDLKEDGPFLSVRFARLQSKLNAQAARLLKEVAGLSVAQWRILSMIAQRKQATSTELSSMTSTDKGLFSRTLKTLILDGLVKSAADHDDHRVHQLSLTRRGLRLFNSVVPHVLARQEALESRLTEDERTMMVRVLEALEAGADAALPKPE